MGGKHSRGIREYSRSLRIEAHIELLPSVQEGGAQREEAGEARALVSREVLSRYTASEWPNGQPSENVSSLGMVLREQYQIGRKMYRQVGARSALEGSRRGLVLLGRVWRARQAELQVQKHSAI